MTQLNFKSKLWCFLLGHKRFDFGNEFALIEFKSHMYIFKVHACSRCSVMFLEFEEKNEENIQRTESNSE